MQVSDKPQTPMQSRLKGILSWVETRLGLDFSETRRVEFFVVLIVVGSMGCVFSAILFVAWGEELELWCGILGTALAAALYTRPRW